MRRLLVIVLSIPVLALGLGTATVLVAATAAAESGGTSPVFINEIHYDNASSDVGEFVEIAGPAGADLTGWSLVLYNGSNGTMYNTIDISTPAIDDEGTGTGAVDFQLPSNGLQNGSPDGIALIDNGTVVQFLSYEGTLTATDGPAATVTSTDIGVSETSSTPIGDSVQLTGAGTTAGDFAWTGPTVASPGDLNTGQTLTVTAGQGSLLLSQYVEGSSNNKAIELANRGTASIDLSTVTVESFNNGSVTPTNTFSPGAGTLAPGAVYVIANPSASSLILSVADATSAVTFFNGDDAIVVSVDGVVVDMFGTVGTDPGSAWTGGGLSTLNQTLCRQNAVTSGNATGFSDPSIEWDGFPIDTTDGLGSADCVTPIPPLSPCLAGTVFIHEIQGDGASTPCGGDIVTVTATVTSLFEDNDLLDGFFLQEEDADADADPTTSEGIFVFCRNDCPAVAPGDNVTVTGQATEFFGMTQISAGFGSGVFVINSTGGALPTPSALTLPAAAATNAEATYEAVEGMLVRFPETLAVSEYFQLSRFGQLVLNAEARPYQFTHSNAPDEAAYNVFLADLATRRIILDDNNNDQNDAIFDGPDEAYYQAGGGLSTTNIIRGGDTITGLTAVMHWSFAGSGGTDAWRLRPVPEAFDYSFTSENPRPVEPDDVGGDLTVASFNVLNYFTTIDDGSNSGCGPTGVLGCRGAHSSAELARQRAKIVDAIGTIDADVVGLLEIENNTDASLIDLVDGLNATLGAGTYAYIDTGTIGDDAIKVGLIYRPADVTPLGAFDILDSSVDPRFDDTKNRPMLTQSFEENGTGAVFTVAVNHLKSKGSSCGAGDDALDGSGNCNGNRTSAAEAIVDYLASDPTGSGDPDVLIIGDLNSYKMETPIAALAAGGYTDLLETFEGPDAYTFVFDGQLGYLDYGLANSDLLDQVTGATAWHINADEVNIYDYNDDIRDPGEASFERVSESPTTYAPDAFRSSDHDPVIIGLSLTPPEPSFECGARSFTVTELEALGYNVVFGTDANEWLFGTRGNDAIFGFAGRDLIIASRGDDLICAGAGNDLVLAGRGNDIIVGGDGFDIGIGQRGHDTCESVEFAISCND
jgi:uncharacterized protein